MNIFQIGCFDGNDSAHTFIKKHSGKIDKCILVDPQSDCLESAKIRYEEFGSKISFYAVAVHPDSSVKELPFYKTMNSLDHSSLLPEQVAKCHKSPASIKKIMVKCMTINEICKECGISHIDMLFIDAEGLDSDIIVSIEGLVVDCVKFERINIDSRQLQEVDQKLRSLNLKHHCDITYDRIYIKEDTYEHLIQDMYDPITGK